MVVDFVVAFLCRFGCFFLVRCTQYTIEGSARCCVSFFCLLMGYRIERLAFSVAGACRHGHGQRGLFVGMSVSCWLYQTTVAHNFNHV
jgi:hypothetical protein